MKRVCEGGVCQGGNVLGATWVRDALEPAGIPGLARGEALLAGAEVLAVRGMVAVCVPAVGWLDACALLLTLPIAMPPAATAPVRFPDFDPGWS